MISNQHIFISIEIVVEFFPFWKLNASILSRSMCFEGKPEPIDTGKKRKL